MSKRLFAFLALFAFAGLPGSAHSEGPGATVEIVKDQGRFKGQTTGGFKDGKAFFAKGVGAIAIKLPSGASCASVSGHLSGATSLVVRAREEGGHCQLSLDGLDEAGLDLAILVGQDTVQFAPKLQVLAEVASQPSAGDVVSNLGVSLAEALRCTPTISSRTTVYEKNRALFIVTPLGSVLAAPTKSIDEDDVIEVRVLADPHLLPFL